MTKTNDLLHAIGWEVDQARRADSHVSLDRRLDNIRSLLGADVKVDVDAMRGHTDAMAEADRGMRGSSALHGAADTEWEISGVMKGMGPQTVNQAGVGVGVVSGMATTGPAQDPMEALAQRVARAICRDVGRDPEALVTRFVLMTGCSPEGAFTYAPSGPDEDVRPVWTHYLETARTAIRVLTEEQPPYWTAHRMLKGWEALVKIRSAMVMDRLNVKVRHHPDEIIKLCDEGLAG